MAYSSAARNHGRSFWSILEKDGLSLEGVFETLPVRSYAAETNYLLFQKLQKYHPPEATRPRP